MTMAAIADVPDLAVLFKSFRPNVRGLARRYSASAPSSVSYEDLVQEGEIAIWRCLGTYRPVEGATFKTYALRRVRGAMIDFIRTQAIGPQGSYAITESWEEDQFAREGERAPSPLDGLLERERIEQIVAAWQELPRVEREVLSKFYSDDRNLADIATDYGISGGRVSEIRQAGEKRVRATIRKKLG